MSRALRHRNYRLFFAGQSISLVGTWLTRVAMSWLVYRLTGSALLLGIVGFASQAPTFFLAPLAGVWVDRVNRHRALIATQVAAMLQSGLLAYFALTHTIGVPHIIVLSILQGLINVLDVPARQAFLVQMIEDRADMSNAIALNSSMVNAARLLGPSIAGLLIAAFGEGWCFAIDAISYLAVIASLLAMRITIHPEPRKVGRVWNELVEGWQYVRGFAPIRAVLLLLGLVGLVAMPYMVLMPVIAQKVLHGGAHTLGFLMAASGIGALIGTLYLASRTTVIGLGKIIAGSALAFGVSLTLLGCSRSLWLHLPLMAATGMAMMVQTAASNTIVQTLVDEDKRGRVMSFFAMAVFGTMPFGSLAAGALADRIGASNTLILCGLGCACFALFFMRALPELRRITRPIYVRMGILPAGLPEIPG